MPGSEFFGRANFEHPAPPSLEVLNTHFRDLDQDYLSIYIPPVNGEWLGELHQRVSKALAKIVTDLENDPAQPKTLLICTHAATMVSTGLQINMSYCMHREGRTSNPFAGLHLCVA
jgi:transcription factor C subunit 7